MAGSRHAFILKSEGQHVIHFAAGMGLMSSKHKRKVTAEKNVEFLQSFE